jgi:hypothetical protein
MATRHWARGKILMMVINAGIPFRQRFRKRGDGDWDYLPASKSWGLGAHSYRVDDATRQRMLDLDRSITRRLVLIVALVAPVITVFLAFSLQTRVPTRTGGHIAAAALVAVPAIGSVVASRIRRRQLNRLLNRTPDSA